MCVLHASHHIPSPHALWKFSLCNEEEAAYRPDLLAARSA